MTSRLADPPTRLTVAPSARRGACPTLQRPMQTGDGLLARLRPIDNLLTLAQLRALAVAARRFGNGIVEITARGSLQVRGLRPETVAPFENAVLAAGIRVATGVGIETPPLAGLDPDEWIDVRPMARELRQRIVAQEPPLLLAPKLAVTIDGGGRYHLGQVSADIRITALCEGGRTKFPLAVGGTSATARPIAVVDEDEIIDAVMDLLQDLAAIGPAARGRDVQRPTLAIPPLRSDPPLLAGIHELGRDDFVLGIALAYSQADAASLMALADAADAAGAHDIRLAPDHGFFVTGLDRRAAEDLQKAAAKLGLRTEPDDPRASIALCAGSRGCASAFYDTRALATRLLEHAPDLLDGSAILHLSGCSKGCAHPAASLLALVGARAGYGLVVNGAASAAPLAYIPENRIDIALQRLQALVHLNKEDGESVSACLTRLGAAKIAAALQRDRT